jgi:ABC-type lipoprotein release transport system permease subunit
MAGYSTTPLAKKLGIKAGNKIKLINAPEYYFELFADMPNDIDHDKNLKFYDLVHFFTKDSKELNKVLPKLKNEIVQHGIIWVSWPKKSAKVATDVTEDTIRDVALKSGLVDVKVCAVDDIWSGLKMVIPLKDRSK